MPSWLHCTIAEEQLGSDSFAARANSYYNERPRLLALLHELYNGYLALADRYCQVVTKHGHSGKSRCSSPVLLLKFDEAAQHDADGGESVDSDAESSLSFQAPTVNPAQAKLVDVDMISAHLVMKMVECEIALNELSVVEKKCGESFRKIEMQRNLLGLLESERLILVNDNLTLEYRVSALVEENKGLSSESVFLKRKTADLARCVLKTREDHRVYELNRKIEDLQGQIDGLEQRNKEYYNQLARQEEKNQGSGAICLGKCFSLGMKQVGDHQTLKRGSKGRTPSTLWDKVKKFTSLLRGRHFSSQVSNSI